MNETQEFIVVALLGSVGICAIILGRYYQEKLRKARKELSQWHRLHYQLIVDICFQKDMDMAAWHLSNAPEKEMDR